MNVVVLLLGIAPIFSGSGKLQSYFEPNSRDSHSFVLQIFAYWRRYLASRVDEPSRRRRERKAGQAEVWFGGQDGQGRAVQGEDGATGDKQRRSVASRSVRRGTARQGEAMPVRERQLARQAMARRRVARRRGA